MSKLFSLFKMVFLSILVSMCSNLYAVNIDKVVVFGDSLSDNGNLYSHTFSIIPKSPPYFSGRFSNGPVWVENLALVLNATLVDYAYGGAWVEGMFTSGHIIPSFGAQITQYRYTDAPFDRHKEQHLYVLWAGANDYMNGRDNAEEATTKTVDVFRAELEELIYVGGKNFVVINLPDFSLVPGILEQGEEFAKAGKILTDMHNQKLAAMIKEVQTANPDAKIIFVDIGDFYNDITAHPEKYKMKNVTTSCYGGGFTFRPQALTIDRQDDVIQQLDLKHNFALNVAYQTGKLSHKANFTCENPDEYLYWDKVHPTRAGHQLFAEIALKILNDNDIYGTIG